MTTEAPTQRKRGRPRDPSADVRILNATRELVAEVGVAGASMSAIADRSGVGKPTIYLRWPNRAAVIDAALQEVLAAAPGDLLEATAAAKDAVDRLVQSHPLGHFLAESFVMPRAEVVLGD